MILIFFIFEVMSINMILIVCDYSFFKSCVWKPSPHMLFLQQQQKQDDEAMMKFGRRIWS